jgi:carbamoyl-phosphate synthase large subunit
VPRRTDIRKILLIGSGPIVIGQACEFDYSGTQACKALREEGFQVVLVNSNPATIMTDPEMADRTYVEPLTPAVLEQIIALERPDALLPTLGGQTGLNLAVALAERGVLERFGVELIGAKLEAIRKAEDRELFKAAMQRIGLALPRSGYARSLEEAREVVREVGYPAIIRPSFTLGGTGGSIAWNPDELEGAIRWGLQQSPIGQVLVEESVIGWKEFELEVMRDLRDNVVIVCSIENFDPMGVHTGDSITVAPAQTLTDKEYQLMRDAALAIIREIGVETGGSNIQFAVNPADGRLVVIEMNPRVSRSSALASKATGFPIAKIAAKLAAGYALDELRNDITRETPASFEPTIDYCVVKVPRWAFEKFPEADQTLTTQMKSVGEVMAIGRTFKEALQKAIRSLEQDRWGLGLDHPPADAETLRHRLRVPNPDRLLYVAEAMRRGLSRDEIAALTRIDPWFLAQLEELVAFEETFRGAPDLQAGTLRRAKRLGFSDRRLAELAGRPEAEVRQARLAHGIRATFKVVDTCAAEFVAHTPYLYSTYEAEDEAPRTDRPKVVILGSGPNRIGQGIEFDYACVHAAFALREAGVEAIMVNCNPETVSTDYDTSDRLYFEPLTLEDVLNVVEKERPRGVIVQFGGQTPLKLAVPLERAGVPILGTPPEAIDRAEDRQRFAELLRKLALQQPPNGSARSADEAAGIAATLGYPVLVRPSYVLGGRAMEIVYEEARLRDWMREAAHVSPDHPVLIDKFLEDALEIDVDALSDGQDVLIGGVMEHIEKAGIHSGDSACALPPYSIGDDQVERLRAQTRALALELGVVGLLNIQFAIRNDTIYVLEVNPRASRTVPFVSKATATPLAKAAARVMLGSTIAELRAEGLLRATGDGSTENNAGPIAVKEAVMPFNRFRTVEGVSVDTILGPEMKSTGEVMGLDIGFGTAFAKSQVAGFGPLPTKGTVFISVANRDKRFVIFPVKRLADLGFEILATVGTASMLRRHGVLVTTVRKHSQGPGPDGESTIVQMIIDGEVDLIFNTPHGLSPDGRPRFDGYEIRTAAVLRNVPCVTTVQGLAAAVQGIEAIRAGNFGVRSLQSWFADLSASSVAMATTHADKSE